VCVGVVLTCILVPGVQSQEAEDVKGGIGIGPLKLVVDATPGEMWNGSFRIVGVVSGQRSTFDIEVRDLTQLLNGQKEQVDRGGGARSASDWIEVESQVTISGKEAHDVPVSIRVPSNAYGAYSAYLTVNMRAPRPDAQVAAAIIPGAAVEVLVRVISSGPLEVGVERIEYQSAGNQLLVDIRNTGVWVSEVRGDVLFYPETGGFPRRVELPYRRDGHAYEIYPEEMIQLQVAAEGVPPGTWRVVSRLDLGQRRESRSEFMLAIGSSARVASSTDSKMEVATDLWIEQQPQEITVPPGGERSVAVRLSNLGEETLTLKVSVEDARLESDGRWTYAASEIPVAGLTVEVTPDTVVIGPKSSAAVRARVRLDENSALSEPAAKAVRFVGLTSREDGDFKTVYDAGAIIIVEATNRGGASLKIEDLELVRVHPQSNPGSAILTVANTGKGIGEIKGHVRLRADPGDVLAELAIGSRNWERIMPGSRRKFRMPLPLVDSGVFVVEVELEQKSAGGELLTADASFTSTDAVPEGLR
jgi:hypothetical protein